jgi:hypothetical protein
MKKLFYFPVECDRILWIMANRITNGYMPGRWDMDPKDRKDEILHDLLEENKKDASFVPEEDWSSQAQEDMLDWIESQGIYIRQ